MSMKRWLLVVAAVLVLLTVAALVISPSRHFLLDQWDAILTLFTSQERYNGYSARHWTSALDSPNDDVRLEAIHGLGALGPEAGAAVPALSKILVESPADYERIEAAMALSKMVPASRTAVPALAQALEDKNLWVRWNAANALQRLGAQPRGKDEAPVTRPAIPALAKAVKDRGNQTNLNKFLSSIQQEAVLALGRASAGSPEGVQTLIDALQDFRQQTRKVVIKTVQGERARQKNDEADKAASMAAAVISTKIAFARALGAIGPEARPAVKLLREMLKEDQISDFKSAAEEALQKIEGQPSSVVSDQESGNRSRESGQGSVKK
jgi:HEAT repeat protein